MPARLRCTAARLFAPHLTHDLDYFYNIKIVREGQERGKIWYDLKYDRYRGKEAD
jgi:hypothetical protein